MGNNRKGGRVGVIILAAIGIGLGAYYYFFYAKPPREPIPIPVGKPEVKIPTPPPPPEKVVVIEEKKVPPPPLVKLGESDNLVRERAKDLSSHSKLLAWLKIKNIIRRIVATVDSISEGSSPRAHLRFLAPKEGLTVKKVEKKIFINPRSYHRYNLVSDVFQSLNTEATIRVYKELKPLFQEAYREQGYPDRDFQDALIGAIRELLRVPVVEGDIPVEEVVLSYVMLDDKLEELSDAQKHLLRMGSVNTRKIQGKLREIALALGVSEKELPKSRVYSLKVK